MCPKFNEVIFISKCFFVGLAYSLEHLANISQIVDIVTFVGSRKQIFALLDFCVKLNCRINYFIFKRSYSCQRYLLFFKVPIKNVAEYLEQTTHIIRFYIESVIVANISHCYNISTTCWWQHSSYECYILQIFPFLIIQIIESTIIHPLSQQFYWWL